MLDLLDKVAGDLELHRQLFKLHITFMLSYILNYCA